jgi:DNA-binding NarL/FixJ family response regulator
VTKVRPEIRIVIVEDHGLVRECLHLVFASEMNLEVVGEAGNGFHAVEVIEELQPDVVLLDIKIPGISGIELLPVIRQKSPRSKVLMLTGKDDEETILTALKAGAKGYLSKDTTSACLIKAIKSVHAGDMWVERRLVNMIVEHYNSGDTGPGSAADTNPKKLTRREQDVLKCLSKGLTNKEIAQQLFISEKTVKSHVNHIFKKLNVSRRLEAVLYAIKSGLS